MTKVWALFRGDMRTIVRCNKILMVMILLYQVAYAFGAFSFLGTLTVVLGGMLAYTSITMDERDGWNRFVLTTGYSRKEYVLSKYLMAVSGTVICSATLGILSVLGQKLGKITLENNILPILPVLMAGTLVMLSVALPLSFWLGMEKARLLSILVIALAWGFSGVFSAITEESGQLTFEGWNSAGLIAVLLSAVILAVSVLISLKVFDRREF